MQRLCLTYNQNFFIRYGRVVRARPFFNTRSTQDQHKINTRSTQDQHKINNKTMELLMAITFKKGKQTKTYTTKNATTAKTIRELMEANGWKYTKTQLLINF